MPGDPLRLLVADDEELPRRLVRQYARAQDVVIVAECEEADAVAPAVQRHAPDAMLLDIRMPGRSIFDVLNELARRAALPAVIFATAYDRYAVRAFELNAVDYLVKPYTADRFGEAIQRVRQRRDRMGGADGVADLIRDLGPRPDRLLVPDGSRMVPIAIADITWIRAEGDYARLHVAGRTYLVSRTLGELEARLDPAQFVRIHRSAIVRIDQIAEVRAEGSSRYRVTLRDDTRLIVSRSRATQLKRWIL